jgi:ADP-ribose pyrophosphatase YjhB (NUDIX family)
MRFFQTLSRVRRAATLGVRIVVEDEAGRVLLLRHTYTPGWHFPGGGVEFNQPALDAVAMELEEEVGLFLTGQPALFGLYANAANFPGDHIAVYRVSDWRQGEATSRGEIAEWHFFDRSALPDGTTPGTLRRLAEVYAGAPISKVW